LCPKIVQVYEDLVLLSSQRLRRQHDLALAARGAHAGYGRGDVAGCQLVGRAVSEQANSPLARLDQATQLLAKARTVDEVKLIHDQAEAARVYARERDLGLQAQNYAAEIKLRAERRLGEILTDMPKNEGTRTIGRNTVIPPSDTPRLADLGLTRVESSRFQQIAKIPEPVFEQHVAEAKAAERELTTAGVVRLAAEQQRAEDAELTDRVFEAAFAINPDGELRVQQAHLRASFSRALVRATDLISLKPPALARVLDRSDLQAAERFIDRFERWRDELRAELAQPLRAVE